MSWLKNKIKSYVFGAINTSINEALSRELQKKQPPIVDILMHNYGYEDTLKSTCPIASDGSPIPWYTYPAIEYFQQLNVCGFRIFEYGSGYSSLYWAHKGAKVWSVEHNQDWFEKISSKSAILQKIELRESAVAYSQYIHEVGGKFDIIIIDGAWRNECAVHALPHLQEGGAIILDNSDWYTDVAKFLMHNKFLPIDFNGIGPINNYTWTTSLFLPVSSILAPRLGHPQPIGGISVCKCENW